MADDFDDGRVALGMALECEGFEVAVCGSAEKVVEFALKFRPEIVLLDLDFGPGSISGYEIAKRIRNLPSISDTMLVAVTGWSRRLDLTEAFAAGFDHYFVKPVDACEIAALTGSLGRASGRSDRSASDSTDCPALAFPRYRSKN